MKNIFLIFALFFLTNCSPESTYTVSYPDSSGQVRYYFYTNKIQYEEDGCITFVNVEDSNSYELCGVYDIEKRK